MPWPFGLFSRSRAAEGQTPAAPAPPRASVRDWAALPPIQRSVGSIPLTAASGAFATGLSGTAGLPLALQPLGHARSMDAPSGLVTGLASPSYAGRERLVYVQRRQSSQTMPGRPVSEEAPPVVETAGSADDVETASPALPEPLARSVRAVEAAPAAPAAPLTVSTMPVAPLPVAPLVGTWPAPAQAGEPSPAAAPAATADAPLVVQPGAEPSSASSRRLNVGQSRRLGLGMPFVPASGRPVVQRHAEPDEPPATQDEDADEAPAIAAPPVQRRIEAAPPAPSPAAPVLPAPGSAPQPPDVQVELSRPIFRVQRRAPGAPPPAPPSAETPSAGGGPEQPAVAMPVVPAVPVVAPAPAGRTAAPPPAVRVQRAEVVTPAEAPPSGTPPAGAAAPPALPVVPVQRVEAGPQDPEDGGPDLGAGPPPLPVVPAQRIESESPAPDDERADMPVVPAQRLEVSSAAAVQRFAADSPVAMPLPPDGGGGRPGGRRGGAEAGSTPTASPDLPSGSWPAHLPGDGGATAATARAVPAMPPVVSRRPADVSPVVMPLAGSRPLAVTGAGSTQVPPAEPAAAGAPPPLALPPAVDAPVLQRLADGPAAAWPAAATTQAAVAALAPVARTARPVAQATAAFDPASSLSMPAPELTYLPVASRGPAADDAVVQRAPEAPQFLTIEVPVQRAEEAPSSAAAAGGAAGAAGGGGQHSEQELDNLARLLYERLRTRLRMELLVDRERGGMIMDLR